MDPDPTARGVARLAHDAAPPVLLQYAAIVLAVILPSARAVAWQTTLPAGAPDSATGVAIDARGDVVVAGWTGQIDLATGVKVAKLHGGTGTPLWTSTFDTSPCIYGGRLALDPSGDAVVGASTEGYCEHWPLPDLLTVVKLDGRRGTEQWRQTPLLGQVFALAVDRDGTVLVAGEGREDVSAPNGAVVLALEGTTGAERWRWLLPGAGAYAVAVDSAGDVVAAGWTLDTYGAVDALAVKLAGVSGEPRWIRALSGNEPWGQFDGAFDVEIDAAGDVLVGGFVSVRRDFHLEDGFTVHKLDGNGGQEIWRQTVYAIGPYWARARVAALAIDGLGDVAAIGLIDDFGATDLMLAKFAGLDGTIRWTHRTFGGSYNQGGLDVAVDSVGDIFAGGFTGANAFSVARLAGNTGAVRWNRELVTANTGHANAIALGPHGTAVAAGDLWDPVTYGDFAVVTFDRATGRAPSCGALCRLDGAAALLDAATAPDIDPQLADSLAHRVVHVSELLAAPSHHRSRRGQRLLAGIVRAVERKLRSGQVTPEFGARLLSLLTPS
jgi:outer membrane protein assembly factor BamB